MFGDVFCYYQGSKPAMVKGDTHWGRRSPHRSCCPSRFVWTGWPWHRSGCLAETARDEGENKSPGTNYCRESTEKANNYSWTQIMDNPVRRVREREGGRSFKVWGKRLRQRKYEYENEAVSPRYADTSRVLSLMSVSSNKRSPTRRCTCLTASHV